MAAGFNAPSILFLSTWDAPERDFMRALSQKLIPKGYERIVEPCAGGFAMPAVHIASGWGASQLECSDVNLFSACVGFAASGRVLDELGIMLDGQDLPLSGDPIADAADVLFLQLELRMDQKPGHAYWIEIRRDLKRQRQKHLDHLRKTLETNAQRFGGMKFEPMDCWQHMREVADDPKTVISINPPTYKGGFEKFFDTGGRLTWSEPPYEIFDAEVHQYELAEEAADWKALLVCQQQQEPGQACPGVVHARDLSRGQVVYVWTNRQAEVEGLMGKSAVPRAGDLVRPEEPLLPVEYDVTPECDVAVRKGSQGEIRYLKDLWLHKLDSSQATYEWVVLIDGHAAGIIGIATPAMQTWANQRGNLLMTYATACPHKDRLTRLVTMLAMSKPVMRQLIDPWVLANAERLITAELTPLPEIKGLRGLMKLKERKPDKQHGNRLIYVSPLKDWTPAEALATWCEKEAKWQQQRQTAAA